MGCCSSKNEREGADTPPPRPARLQPSSANRATRLDKGKGADMSQPPPPARRRGGHFSNYSDPHPNRGVKVCAYRSDRSTRESSSGAVRARPTPPAGYGYFW
ncbi:hypothetical protein MGN70_012171 [Eutypa lata]|uniref:Uncharacterized protein n=1 Tax=Eutypa lata (strain UCR-EL1) TaxID=1287681 RepID=M7TMR9_EUTLA|nr:hypothetical protein UCREL1_4985 [Eutypa lata UCREL1]KAI1245281.1 hypothetical protein MGN70_012171 [Eutypa lata]